MQRQLFSNWCWAAVAASFSAFFGRQPVRTQCVIVNAELGQNTCCVNGNTPQCNQPWYLDSALQWVGCFRQMIHGIISQLQCSQEVCTDRRPVGVRIGWNTGGGHFVVIAGINGQGLLEVKDPWTGGTTFITYDTLANSYQGSGTWTHTYLTH